MPVGSDEEAPLGDFIEDAEATDAEEGSPEPDGGKPVRSWRRVIGVGVALLTGWWDQFIVWVQVRFVTDTQLPI
mgnify:CR=1 FL=1